MVRRRPLEPEARGEPSEQVKGPMGTSEVASVDEVSQNTRVDMIVVGGSAGGVEAVTQVVESLPSDLNAAVFIVIHFPEFSDSVLPAILNRRGRLKAVHAEDGMAVEPGHIYVARPGKHLLVRRSVVRLVEGPKENGNRPAIDPLFRTAARSCGPSVAGVLLSGMLDDGTMGMAAVKRFGGVTIAQDPEEATFSAMPRNAIERVGVQHVLPLDQIGPLLVQLTREGVSAAPFLRDEKDPTEMNPEELAMLEHRGRPSTFTCPECHGTLFELEEDGLLHYRCRVGHAYSFDTLATEQRTVLEAALWTALRSIEENNSLLVRLIERSEAGGFAVSSEHYRQRLKEGRERSSLLRHVLEGKPIRRLGDAPY